MLNFGRIFFGFLILANLLLITLLMSEHNGPKEEASSESDSRPHPSLFEHRFEEIIWDYNELKEFNDLQEKAFNEASDDSGTDLIPVSIIIDDIGFSKERAIEIMNISKNITLSVLPFTEFGKELAELAFEKDIEVMLHLPLESLNNDQNTEDGTIFSNMPRNQIEKIIKDGLIDIPFVKGVNNHKGSAISKNVLKIKEILEILSVEKLFYIDSKTTPDTVVKKIAEQMKINFCERDIFLDHIQNMKSIEIQFNKLVKIAKKNKKAIAIGHPYESTILFLKGINEKLRAEKLKLVPVSSIL